MYSRMNFPFRSFFRSFSHQFTNKFTRNNYNLLGNWKKPLLTTTLFAFIPANIQLKDEQKVEEKTNFK